MQPWHALCSITRHTTGKARPVMDYDQSHQAVLIPKQRSVLALDKYNRLPNLLRLPGSKVYTIVRVAWPIGHGC
ncbi:MULTISPECIES: hypothetical protein [unclassified Moorena]|uniref:hypothetical protein n=1 Tax=unclassified Moorena TaxID=2683338 RepID=UPI0013F8DC90|nr:MULTISPECIES: hypothetical protein [unclassified Moorena]NEO17617.1 hypothetical protein [Moorena sp. SIO3E8]NEP29729.1 hypothetical protein [Moorena sp. SIO3I6]NEQ04167.1 hypothetical protein [Moorena sp. SIO3F7]